MIENRRAAVRVNLGEPGLLEFSGRRIECLVLDLSALGIRVRVAPPQLIPDRVTVKTTVAGQPVALKARVRRAEPGLVVALRLEDPENSQLHRLITDVQRREIGRGLRAHAERRRSPR